MRFLNLHDIPDIERMTLHEYSLRMAASRLRRLDRQYEIHLQAWANQQAKATKKNGKPIYVTFKEFFDYEGEEKKIFGFNENIGDDPLARMVAKANRKRGREDGEL